MALSDAPSAIFSGFFTARACAVRCNIFSRYRLLLIRQIRDHLSLFSGLLISENGLFLYFHFSKHTRASEVAYVYVWCALCNIAGVLQMLR